ncbi:MAG: CRISPR-associated helicase Cas3' [Candidatus Aenigmatarchaeota archaeon]
MDIKRQFRRLVGEKPYGYQLEGIESLLEGNSVVLRAPTGSGKTEIPLLAFVQGFNDSLPSQLLYSLPTRTLVESIGERAEDYAKDKGLKVAIHHGRRVESNLFEEDIIVSTIDQTVGAYASVPLSMPKSSGNIFLGAVGAGLNVFDEVHTFDLEKGLQSSLVIVVDSVNLGIPSLIMSATIPDIFIKKVKNLIEKHGGKVDIVDVKDEFEIKSRKKRSVELIYRNGEVLESNRILREFEDEERILVVANTVGRAQKLYRKLKDELKEEVPVILLHSRFLEKDREIKEEKLKEVFGKNGKGEGILISTQVIEVGLDISSFKVLSEMSPIDSLIQRAGRCARWGGKGEFHVFWIDSNNPYAPYTREVMEATKEEIRKRKEFILDWETEIELVNSILNETFSKFMDPRLFYQRLGTLSRAVYEGNKGLVEKNVREIFSCDIILHDNPESLKINNISRLPRINVDFRVLKTVVRKENITAYQIAERKRESGEEGLFEIRKIRSPEDIYPFELYVLKGASYDKEIGLMFEEVEGAIHKFETEEDNKDDEEDSDSADGPKKEGWIEHGKNVLKIFDKMLLRYRYPLKIFSENFDYDFRKFINIIKGVVALHDIGKLNMEWQEKIGWNGERPLAYVNRKDRKIGLPPHATVSARVLQPYLEEKFEDEGLFKAFYLSVAHHHSPWAVEYKKYELIPNFYDYVKKVYKIPREFLEEKSEYDGKLNFKYLDMMEENRAYRLYGLLSKFIRISDRCARKGVDYESLFSG